jgi:hypothetical protein
LSDYKEAKGIEEEYDNQHLRLYKKTYEQLDYCFTQVLRRKDEHNRYQSTPNVLLAEGDIIRMCCGTKSPAKVVSIYDPSIKLEKGEIFQKELKEELDKLDIKDYFSDERGFKMFKVIETPIITELKTLFENIESQEQDKRLILFDQQKVLWKRIMNIVLIVILICAFALSLTWIIVKGVKFYKMLSHPVYMIIVLYYISIPTMLKIIDAWSNSVIISLSESLQEEDYNKKLKYNYFKYLMKQKKTRNKTTENHSKKNNHQKKSKNTRRHIKGFVKVDTFYEEFHFAYQIVKDNWPKFKKMLFEGVSMKENYVGILSSATIVAFTDLEGII